MCTKTGGIKTEFFYSNALSSSLSQQSTDDSNPERMSEECLFTFLCSDTRERSSSSSWLLAAAGSREGAQSGGRGGREVVEPGAQTDFRASWLIDFHRDWFWRERRRDKLRFSCCSHRALPSLTQDNRVSSAAAFREHIRTGAADERNCCIFHFPGNAPDQLSDSQSALSIWIDLLRPIQYGVYIYIFTCSPCPWLRPHQGMKTLDQHIDI